MTTRSAQVPICPAAAPAPGGSPLGLHRVLDPPGVLPQAALAPGPGPRIAPDEVRVRVDRLNLDAASYRQLRKATAATRTRSAPRCLEIIETRGKMHNPVTGSGGMLIGTSTRPARESPLGLRPGQRVATLVSLTLTPLHITDGLAPLGRPRPSRCPCEGHAILFARSIAAVLPEDLPAALALAVLDVCGAPALTQPRRGRREGARSVVDNRRRRARAARCPAAAAAPAGAGTVIGVVPDEAEAALLRDPDRAGARLVDEIVIADARDPVAPRGSRRRRPGRRHRRVRGRARLRARRDPVHRPGRHGDLLLHGDVVHAPRRSAPRAWPPT